MIEEMVTNQMNEGRLIKGRNILGELEPVEVVVVLQDNPEEVNLETQGVESGKEGVVVQGKAQVVCHPRWRREALT